ncbi:MAG: ATP-binding protein [Campylobacterota bacterium]|nr:ATP-binding protein [Campylobacterota bacterium]
MRKDKNQILADQFNEYLENDDIESIKEKLPKLISSFLKISSRTDRILKQSDSQQHEVLKLTEKLEDTNTKVNNLLNNANQGFLYFNSEMVVGEEYSKAVDDIFCIDVSYKDISELLYPDDKNDSSFLKATLQSILQDDPMRQEILISLLQKEFFINNKHIELEYKILSSTDFMLILTDITSKKELAQKIKDEQQVLKMVVETVTSIEQFLDVKSDYEDFTKRIDTYKNLDKLSDLRKEIHTYKGLFAQKEMLNIVKELHQFESLIDNSLKKEKLDEVISNTTTDTMNSWLQQDIDVLIKILGDKIFEKSSLISIDKNRILEIENKLKNILSLEKNTLDQSVYKDIEDIKKATEKLTYKNIEIYFKPYEKLVEQLAKRLDKYINPLILNLDDVYVPVEYSPFLNSLVHLFRNSVDHGIEILDERYEKEKSEYGTISCDVIKEDKQLVFKIKDDGNGVDIDKIKDLAVEKGIYTKEQVDSLSEDEIVLIICKDSFSTSKQVTTISGRGVGLASIISELEKLDGKISVNNNFGYGIEFIFTIPFES